MVAIDSHQNQDDWGSIEKFNKTGRYQVAKESGQFTSELGYSNFRTHFDQNASGNSQHFFHSVKKTDRVLYCKGAGVKIVDRAVAADQPANIVAVH